VADAFLLIGLPYLAIVVAVVGSVVRLRHDPFRHSARSSQFLESRQLRFGSGAWHIGIGLVLAGHLAAFLFPGAWLAFVSLPGMLGLVELVGMIAAALSLVGLVLLLVRRLTSGRVQAVTSTMDLVVVALLIAQVALGLLSAVQLGNGAHWAVGTVVPYLWSLLGLRPDMSLVADFPLVLKLHLAGAWLIVLLLPFTRLLHLLALPVSYLWRSPQLVVWNTARGGVDGARAASRAESRRAFLKGGLGLAGASGLLAVGVSEKAVNFFKGPRPDGEAEADLLEKKLGRLRQSAEERELELERRRSTMLFVAGYAELQERKGRYVIGWDMAPVLAFRGADGWPVVRSAKCTHLGCTVGSDMDEQGRILCPCHVSWFHVTTGQPAPGAPARLPLPEIGWALLDAAGTAVARKDPGTAVFGPAAPQADPAALMATRLVLTRPPAGV
jgi:nitrate reductase gamma subunit